VQDTAGHLIDLSPLRHTANAFNNWEVADPATGESIFVNVCAELVPTSALPTACEGSSACRVTRGGATSKIGTLAGEPQYPSGGTVQLWYPAATGGQVFGGLCGTLISFTCQPGTLGTPVLAPAGSANQVGSSGCVTLINWQSSVACNEPPVTVGSNCEVQDNVTGVYFDLRPLKALPDIQVSTGSGTVAVAACRAARGCQGGVCSGSSSLGFWNDAPRYTEGQLVLVYDQGAQCSAGGGGTYTTTIVFQCDEAASPGQPTHDAALSSGCNHYFTWRTRYACTHIHEVECLAHDAQGNEYDLSALKRTAGQSNWIVAGTPQGYEVLINVCHDLIPDSRVQLDGCGDGAAGCQVEGSTYRNLGTAGFPTFDHNQLVMHMHNGQPCGNGRHRETTVTFTCDESAGLGTPTYGGEPSHCVYDITWRTSAACRITEQTSTQSCSITTSAGQNFDLEQLAQTGPVQVDSAPSGSQFELGICGTRLQCNRPGAGACVGESSGGGSATWYSLGRPSGLQATSSSLTYTYAGGDPCPNIPNYRRTATVSFVCDKTAPVNSMPVFARNDRDCFYSFVWRTRTACAVDASECVVFDTHHHRPINLAMLPAQQFTLSNIEYTVSPCSTLSSMSGDCATAGICMHDQNGQMHSLGSRAGPPTFASDGTVTVTYASGGTCPTGSSAPATATVRFICSGNREVGAPRLATGGTPSFTSNNCNYRFEWHTCLVCGEEDPCGGQLTTPKPGEGPTSKPGPGAASSDGGTSSGTIAAVVIVIIAVVGGVVYLLRTQEKRDELRAALGMTSSVGYQQVRTKGKKYAKSVELSDNLLFGSDNDSDDSDFDDDNEEDDGMGPGGAYGASPLGLTETSLSMDILNGEDEDEDDDLPLGGEGGTDEALLPL